MRMQLDASLWVLVVWGLIASMLLVLLLWLQAVSLPITEWEFIVTPTAFWWTSTLGFWLQAMCFAIATKLVWKVLR